MASKGKGKAYDDGDHGEKSRLVESRGWQETLEGDTDDDPQVVVIGVQGYRASLARRFFFVLGCIFSAGILYAIMRMFPRYMTVMRKSKCDLVDADTLLIQRADGSYDAVSVQRHSRDGHATTAVTSSSSSSLSSSSSSSSQQNNNSVHQTRSYGSTSISASMSLPKPGDVSAPLEEETLNVVVYRCFRYVYNSAKNTFDRVKFNVEVPYPDVHTRFGRGHDSSSRLKSVNRFGSNLIDVPVKSFFAFLLNEALHPFYLFQIFSVTIWMVDDYWIYGTAIFFSSLISATTNVVQLRSNAKNLQAMAVSRCNISLLARDGSKRMVSSEDLVPGDLVEIDENVSLPCDMVLMSGTAVVNESMLTGESVPVAKSSLPFDEDGTGNYSPEADAKYTLYSGTIVVQARGGGIKETSFSSSSSSSSSSGGGTVAIKSSIAPSGNKPVALVIRTGFDTAKGRLVRSILHPKPTNLKFHHDSFKFIGVLFTFALGGFVFSSYTFHKMGAGLHEIALRSLDLITIIIPPALPIALTIGVGFAIKRLKTQQIFCISPQRVNEAGKIKMMCFDKTGTLTIEGLDVKGVRVSSSGSFYDELLDKDHVHESPTALLHTLAGCHSLNILNGEYIGEPLEIKMFETTGWRIEDDVPVHGAPGIPEGVHQEMTTVIISPSPSSYKLRVLKIFQFSSQLQRMTVMCYNDFNKSVEIYSKGSPEIISGLCDPSSLPSDFEQVLSEYTANGYRVLALATNTLALGTNGHATVHDCLAMSRDHVEDSLNFVGFLIMDNPLKPDTPNVIKMLSDAGIRNVMITGDNLLTAVCVGKLCNIVGKGEIVFLGDLNEHHVPASASLIATSKSSSNLLSSSSSSPSAYDVITWSCPANPSLKLNPRTLRPERPLPEGTNYTLAISGRALTALKMLHNATNNNNNNSMNADGASSAAASSASASADNSETGRLLHRVMVGASVFARVSPSQKALLVEEYANLGFCVGFCGDGANDCGALKAARVGLSLSSAEASIAAPFTSKFNSIFSVATLIREGRCALVTSFQLFKYMALYSLIQFSTVIMLYRIGSTLGDVQFLYIDMALILPLAFGLSLTGSYSELVKKKPTSNLMSRKVLVSLIGQFLIQVLFLIGAYFFLLTRDFFVPVERNDVNPKDNVHCMENSTLFLFSIYQYIGVVLAFCINKPFRRPFYTNPTLSLSLIVLIGYSIFITLRPDPISIRFLQLYDLPFMFRLQLLGLAGANAIVTWLFERLVVLMLMNVLKCSCRGKRNREKNVKPYKRIVIEGRAMVEYA